MSTFISPESPSIFGSRRRALLTACTSNAAQSMSSRCDRQAKLKLTDSTALAHKCLHLPKDHRGPNHSLGCSHITLCHHAWRKSLHSKNYSYSLTDGSMLAKLNYIVCALSASFVGQQNSLTISSSSMSFQPLIPTCILQASVDETAV